VPDGIKGFSKVKRDDCSMLVYFKEVIDMLQDRDNGCCGGAREAPGKQVFLRRLLSMCKDYVYLLEETVDQWLVYSFNSTIEKCWH